MPNNDYDAGIPLWTVASKYFNMVSLTASEVAIRGNPSSAMSSLPLSPDEVAEQTKWSDTDLSVPMLFDFYHGLEVMMKGFLVAEGQSAKGHNLSILFKKVIAYHPNEPVFQLMDSYIDQSKLTSPLKEFFQENGIIPNSFYEVFKYPETMKGRPISHAQLKYGGTSTAGFYNKLADDAKQISKLSARLTHSWRTAPA